MQMIKAAFAVLFLLAISLQVHASAKVTTLSFSADSDDSDNAYKYATAMKALQAKRTGPKESQSVVLTFEKGPQIFQIDYTASARVSDPHGDFYFLTGNLDDRWTDDDYKQFYSLAKWLSKMGFRVIINPVAFVSDAREAAENPKTAAIIWNGHGANDGTVYDADDSPLPPDIFTKNKSANFKYMLFANCWGKFSGQYYRLDKTPKVFTKGWARETTSDDLFGYLFSDNFNTELAKALNVRLQEKPHDSI